MGLDSSNGQGGGLSDGDNFDGQGTSDFSDLNSAEMDSLNTTPTEGDNKSLYAALSQGYAVGLSPNAGMKAVDPANFADHTTALQALNDWLINRTTARISVWIPPEPNGGGPWDFPSTVEWGDTAGTKSIAARVFLPWGGEPVSGNATITTGITNGDPIFRFVASGSNTLNGSCLKGGTWDGQSQDCGIVEFESQSNWSLEIPTSFEIGGDAVKIDGQSWGWYIGNSSIRLAGTGRGIVFTDKNTVDDPGNGVIGPGTVVEGTNAGCVVTDTTVTDVVSTTIHGHYEGTDGSTNALLDLGVGDWIIASGTLLGNTTTSANAINVSGKRYVVSDAYLNGSIDGDGINIDNPTQIRISPALTDEVGIGGETINVVNAPDAANFSILPYENTLRQTTSYHDGPWSGTYYPDGWQKYRAISDTTVPAGGTATLQSYAGRIDSEMKAHVFLSADPAANVQWEKYWGWDTGNSQVNLIVEEKSGTASIDVGAVIYRRGAGDNLR